MVSLLILIGIITAYLIIADATPCIALKNQFNWLIVKLILFLDLYK